MESLERLYTQRMGMPGMHVKESAVPPEFFTANDLQNWSIYWNKGQTNGNKSFPKTIKLFLTKDKI